MAFGTEVIDVTDAEQLPDPVFVDRAAGPRALPGGPPAGDGARLSNVDRFTRAIERLLGVVRSGRVQGGVLYLPPGRYLIENQLPLAWSENLWGRYRRDRDAYPEALLAQRFDNPFGASLRIPKELTLWLAPGAVLVPASRAIVHIESDLSCDPRMVFDTSHGGLIVFGQRVPRLLANWWGVLPGEDHADALTAAIRAGVINRSNAWESPYRPSGSQEAFTRLTFEVRVPVLPVELMGEFTLRRTVEVREHATHNDILGILAERTFTAPEQQIVTGNPSNTTIAGAWEGRRQQGASLVAGRPFVGPTLLRLLGTTGLTLRNIAFDTGEAEAVTCLDIMPLGPPQLGPMQGISVRACVFGGMRSTLVRVGMPPDVITPGDAATPPLARPSIYGSDISGLCFDDCSFAPRQGGIGLSLRTSQSVPFRLADCEFVGTAEAMISAWEGTFLLNRCYFANDIALPVAVPARAPGFEEPDGSDIFLRFEPPIAGTPPVYSTDTLAAFTAIGCLSRSGRFLSTAKTQRPDFLQRQEWPVVLLNVRHLPHELPADGASIRWGMRGAYFIIRSADPTVFARMGRSAPLAIIGGQYRGALKLYSGAVQSAVIGARNTVGTRMAIDTSVPFGAPMIPFDVFGLPVDRNRRLP